MRFENRSFLIRAEKWNDFLNHKTDDETLERCRKIDQMINQKIQQQIADTPTVDPETLPIVQKLREELARVTEERDAAVKTIFEWTGCPECKQWDSENEWCMKHDREADSSDGCNTPEWRGAKEG